MWASEWEKEMKTIAKSVINRLCNKDWESGIELRKHKIRKR